MFPFSNRDSNKRVLESLLRTASIRGNIPTYAPFVVELKPECRVKEALSFGSEFRASGFGVRASVLGFRVSGLGFRAPGLGFIGFVYRF